MFGGKVVSHYEQGRTAANMAAKVLTGTPAATLQVVADSLNVFTFDYREMERFRLNKSSLPSGAVFVNAPESVVEEYVRWVIAGLIVLAIQTGLIFLLINNARRRKLAELSLRESDARFRAFFDNSPSIMYMKDPDHTLTYVNARYLSFHGLESQNIIGKRGGSFFDTAKRAKVEDLDRQMMKHEVTVNEPTSMTSRSGESGQFYLTKFPVYGAMVKWWVLVGSISMSPKSTKENRN